MFFSVSAQKLTDYGFEDYTGNVETTPGYIFTASAPSYWSDHTNSSGVLSSCSGNTAHSGTYYFHQGFYTGATDACLGFTPQSISDHGNIGLNGSYPTTVYGSNLSFLSSVDSILVVRFWVRATGDWANDGPVGKAKFVRVYGNSVGSSFISHYTISDNRLQIYDSQLADYGTGVVLPSTLYDGNWHCFVYVITLNNTTDSAGNLTGEVYYDDPDMTGSPILTRTITSPDFGSQFYYWDFFNNWSATYPSAQIGFDLDDVQVWNGFPTSEASGWAIDSVSVNGAYTPGTPNDHYSSGNRRLTHIDDDLWCLGPSGTLYEDLYHSDDNGATWTQVTQNYGRSGVLITGKDKYNYHFYRNILNGNLYMEKFLSTATTVSSPVQIGSTTAGDLGAYYSIAATVDSAGVIYVVYPSGSPDALYIMHSIDAGATWSTPVQAITDVDALYEPKVDVNKDNVICLSYSRFNDVGGFFATSTDSGATWTEHTVSAENVSNPAFCTIGDSVYYYVQSSISGNYGVLLKRSTDLGATWSSWITVNTTCGYGDPSTAIGNDGTLYLGFRSNDGSGITSGTCGDMSKYRLGVSTDNGDTWTFPEDAYGAERGGLKNQLRYQTWWSYGGRLDYIWLQDVGGGTSHEVFYDYNPNITILSGTVSSGPDVTPPSGNRTLTKVSDTQVRFQLTSISADVVIDTVWYGDADANVLYTGTDNTSIDSTITVSLNSTTPFHSKLIDDNSNTTNYYDTITVTTPPKVLNLNSITKQ